MNLVAAGNNQAIDNGQETLRYVWKRERESGLPCSGEVINATC